MTPPLLPPAPAPYLPLALAGLTALMTACGGGGGVSVPAAPAPAPSPTAIERVSAACTDPTPAVTETAVFDTTEATGISGDGTRVSANRSTVCFTSSATGAVRSTTAIGPGQFHYFEATRSNAVSVGVGTATAPMAPTGGATANIASTAQSLLITDGTVYTRGAFIGNFNVGDETRFGIAVDYRGPHPIVYVLGSTLNGQNVGSAAPHCTGAGVTIDAATPCLYGRHVLGGVTTPLYLYASGNTSNAGQTARLSINTGGAVTPKPFTYGALKVRQAVRGGMFKGEVGLNAQWVGTTATPATPLPTIAAGARTRSVLVAGDTMPFAGSDSLSVTAPGSSVQWLSDTGALLGSTATLSLADPTVRGLIGTGAHRIQAVATDGTTGKLDAVDFHVTYAAGNTDDTDGDGLDYAAEKAAGTDPANPDTDADGIADGVAMSATAGSPVVLQRQGGVSGLATSQGVVLDDDRLTVVLNADVNPDCTEGTLPAEGNFGTQPLSEEQCKKRAIRASEGVPRGQFRYYETRRATASGINGFNMGQGFITGTGKIDPFCCGATGTPDPRTPPSFMANSADGFWDTLVSIPSGLFSPAQTTVIGFAVDYTNVSGPPVVHAITRDAGGTLGVFTRTIAGFTGDAIPFVYGHPYSDTLPAMEINFGLKAFAYDARAVLTNAGVPNVGSLVLGVGIHRRP